MPDAFVMTPGQTLRLTIERIPRRAAQRKTILRLMRQDGDVKRALRRAQRERERTLVVRSRGRRPWAVRRQSSQVGRVEAGQSWTMPAVPTLQRDLDSVASFLKIERT